MLNDATTFNYVYLEDNKICNLSMTTKKSNRTIPVLKQRTTYLIENIDVKDSKINIAYKVGKDK